MRGRIFAWVSSPAAPARPQLISMKAASGRAEELRDIAALEAARRTR